MTNYWIFIFIPYSDFSGGEAEQVMQRTQETGRWYIGDYTPQRNNLRPGDKIVFYQASGLLSF